MNYEEIRNKKIIVFFFGTRPEIIKLFVLYRILKKSDEFYPVLFNTAQQSISNDILSHLNLKFDIISDEISNRSTDLNEFISHLLNDFNNKLNSKSSSLQIKDIAGIVIQGDTASAYTGSLWGFLNHIPVFHVEAGLRTFDHENPFPEEFYRESIGRMSSLNFCPTSISYDNLIKEGIKANKNYIVGNTINDVIVTLIDENKIKENNDHNFILSTFHRRENWNNVGDYARILDFIIKEKIGNLRIIHLMHPNPLIKKGFDKAFDGKYPDNLIIRNPIHDYFEMLGIVRNSNMILTDSGGLQEESMFFNIPCGVLRKVTERPEVLKKNAKLLSFNNSEVAEFVESSISFNTKKEKFDYTYGYGNTSELIYEILKNYYDF
ncbi:MAG TPA: UDP-N-acetylglucosamine 2-epimerase (non-hydrolyzing) [Ignavibacteria bacterium]